jgi:hypothetical protein
MLLSELAGKHQGETVWVTGSGHSLSFIDPGFFDGQGDCRCELVCKHSRASHPPICSVTTIK